MIVGSKLMKEDVTNRLAIDQSRVTRYQKHVKDLSALFAPAAKHEAAESVMQHIGGAAPCHITATAQISPTQRKNFVGEFGDSLGFRAGESFDSSLDRRLGVIYSIFV